MNRESLINRLVERKLASGTKKQPFCICMAIKIDVKQRAAWNSKR